MTMGPFWKGEEGTQKISRFAISDPKNIKIPLFQISFTFFFYRNIEIEDNLIGNERINGENWIFLRDSKRFKYLTENDDVIDENLTSQEYNNSQNSEELLLRKIQLQQALKEKNYEFALSLVKNDADFPDNIKLDEIEEIHPWGVALKTYLTKVLILHYLIEFGEKGEEKLEADESSKFHLNFRNESALFTAAKSKNFEAFAFLRTIGAEFKNSDERDNAIRELNAEEVRKLDNISFNCIKRVEEKRHLKYLNLQSGYNCTKAIEYKYLKNFVRNKYTQSIDFVETITSYYGNLDQIPEISTVLKVFKFTDNLEIAFNFNGNDTSDIAISQGKCNLGSTNYHTGEIIIGAKQKKKLVLGTIAHELTHMAMEIVYNNHCNPYHDFSEEVKQNFESACAFVHRLKSNSKDPAERILAESCDYEEHHFHCEVIARVSEILTVIENGRHWLEKHANKLYEFYKNVISDCSNLIENGSVYRVNEKIKHLNESQGEINRIRSLGVLFKDINKNLERFLQKQNQIFTIQTKTVTLTSLRTLQAFYQKTYLRFRNEYFVFTLEKLVENLFTIRSICEIQGKMIIIEVDDFKDSDLDAVVKMISQLRRPRPTLKFIFVVLQGMEELKKKLLEYNLTDYLEEYDEKFTLDKLDDKSMQKILEREVIFQGKTMNLNRVMDFDKHLVGLINVETIGKLCEEKKLNIGGEILGTSSLEGAYVEVVQEVNVETLNSYFEKNKTDIFIINGLEGEKKECRLEEEIRNQNSETKISHLIRNNSGKFAIELTTKKILFTDSKWTVNDFKTFCRLNSNKKIYLIDIVRGENESKFLLKMYYNPNFYLKREFKIIEEQKEEIQTGRRKSKEKSIPCNEDNLASKIGDENLVIICDEPGMGKTTTLTKLYEKMSENHWVIKITLKDNLEAIKAINEKKFSTENLITFLTETDENLKNDLTKNFLKLATEGAENFKYPLLLFLDGFDEVSSETERKKLIFLLKNLKINNKRIKVWVTTRLNFKRELQEELNTFIVEFKGFGMDMKRKFVDDYLEDRLALVLDEKKFRVVFPKYPSEKKKKDRPLVKYREELIKKMSAIFGNQSRFIGTPLQLNLTLANSLESFKKYIFVNNINTEPDFTFLGENLLDIYKNYLDMKYEVYFNKTGKKDNAEKDLFKQSFNSFNKDLAESLIFNQDLPNEILKKKIKEDYKILMYSSGILSQSSNLEFIHNTFREYFSAVVFTDYIKKERIKRLHFDLIEFLLKHIFVMPQYQLMRNFINLIFKQMNFDDLNKKLVQKMGWAIILLWGRSEKKEKKVPEKKRKGKGVKELDSAFSLAEEEKNDKIFEFLMYCCKEVSLENNQPRSQDQEEEPGGR